MGLRQDCPRSNTGFSLFVDGLHYCREFSMPLAEIVLAACSSESWSVLVAFACWQLLETCRL